MKKHIYLITLVSAIFYLSSCNNTEKATETQVAEVKTDSTAAVGVSNSEKLLKKIMGTGDGLLRSVSFGTPIEQVKKTETAEKFEEDEDHVGFSFDSENLETVDILYLKDQKNLVNEIQLDIYLNSQASTDSLMTLMSELFTLRYGKSISTDSTQSTWKIKPKGEVSIKKVITKLDKGLGVKFVQEAKSIQ